MANPFSNIAQIMGNRGMQRAAPAPTDPRQQTMMQQLGITNPLLQQFGQQIGNLAGVDMRSAAQQTASGLQGLDPSDPKSLLGVAKAIQGSDPEKAAQLRAKAAEITATQKAQQQQIAARESVASFFEDDYGDIAQALRTGQLTAKDAFDLTGQRKKSGANTNTLTKFVATEGQYKGQEINALIDKENGDVIKELGPTQTAGQNITTSLIEQVDENGFRKKILINNKTGDIIKEFGRADADKIEVKKLSDTEWGTFRNGQLVSTTDTQTAAEKSAIKQEALIKAGNVISTATEAKDLIRASEEGGYFSLGAAGWAGLLSILPESEARALQSKINVLKSNAGFDALKRLKAEGGTLGQVSNIENILLQSEIASLDILNSPEELIAAIDRIEQSYRRVIDAAAGNLNLKTLDNGDQVYKINANSFGLIKPDGSFEIVKRDAD
jgi:hypothetical protein